MADVIQQGGVVASPGRAPHRWLCRLVDHAWTQIGNDAAIRCDRCRARVEIPPQQRDQGDQAPSHDHRSPRGVLGSSATSLAAVDAVTALVALDAAGFDRALKALRTEKDEGLLSLILLAALASRTLSTSTAVGTHHRDDRVLLLLRELSIWAALDTLDPEGGPRT